MPVTAAELRTNTRTNPFGTDNPTPAFSWSLISDEPGVTQRAYQVQVSDTDRFDGALMWDSERQESNLPFGVCYGGSELASAHRYCWRVRVWTGSNQPSSWSSPAWFETALLDRTRWSAQWISGSPPSSRRDNAALYLRGYLTLAAQPVRGRAYVSALGWYRFFVNGVDITGLALVPRWTPLDNYVEYQTYDVTEQLHSGQNVIAVAVGDGRYRGRLGVFHRRRVYGDRLAALVQVEADLADGATITAASDGTWHAGPGRITGSDPKSGERVDLRIPDQDWLTGPTPPSRFRPAAVLPGHGRRLIAEEVGRVRDIARLAGTVQRAPSGAQIVDFGQNFCGVVRIRLRGPAGTTVRLTHSELLTADGELDTHYLMVGPVKPIPQRDDVILSGEDTWYQPWFTVHGFRYLEVRGLDYQLPPDDVEGVVLSSDLPAVGSFECSDARLNRLHHNVMWSLRSNFADTATDCPTRERSGWTGDIQIFASTAATLVDAQAFLRRYLRNVATEQLRNGTVPPVVPSETSRFSGGIAARLFRWLASSTGWGDAAVILPWTLYRYYGDTAILARQYDSVRRWVDHLEHEARTKRGRARWFAKRLPGHDRSILGSGYHWGEWLRPGEDMPKAIVGNVIRPDAVVATAYFAHSARLLGRIAAILDRTRDAQHYESLADRVADAWRIAFVGPDGRIGRDRQDDYVRALAFDLLTPVQRAPAMTRLAELIERAGCHLGTGVMSTAMLLPVLAENGRPDLALKLLLQHTNPSWLYQVEHGATTTWETWEGYHKSSGAGKDSHNHYAFGAVAGWLTEGIAGLSPTEPGYRHIRVAPVIGGGITHAAARLETPFGVAASAWRLTDDRVHLEVTIPPGATAEIRCGDGRSHCVGPGQHTYGWQHTDVDPPR